MNKLDNIYTKKPLQLSDMDTVQDENADDWEWDFTIFYKAFDIVYDKFLFVRLDKEIHGTSYYDSYDIFNLYSDLDINPDLSNIHIEISNSLTNFIAEKYDEKYIDKKLTLADKNNIKHFLRIAFEKKTIPKEVKKDYITIRKFCKCNNINEYKLKKILKSEGYYNKAISFMPSRKSMDKDKVFITNYFMPDMLESKRIDNKYLGNFYILWENQFLRNMMLKHYRKCKKDSDMYKIRYRQPKLYYTLMKRINELIWKFCSLGLSINGDYTEDKEFIFFEWDDLHTSFFSSYMFPYLDKKFMRYSEFKYFETKINKIVEGNIKTIDDEKIRESVKEYLDIFNKYAKHYKDKYDKEDNKLPQNPNHHTLNKDDLVFRYYS